VKLAFEPVGVPTAVFGDPDRLTQVITNIVSNACKFSPKGETVTVALSKPEGKVRVSISDRGSGIPEEFKSRIFHKFAQADFGDASSRKGTGLGLAISKAFVERMDGTIGFSSEPGRGTTFYFELTERRLEPAPASDRSRPRVLICEDDRDVAEILRTTLDQDGFDTDVAATLDESKSFLGKGSYAAMILGLALPDGRSVPFVRELRTNPKTANLPLIVVSASMEEGRKQVGGQAFGIVDWLEKPLTPERLSKALHQIGKDASGKSPRVLHVEDDPDICRIVRTLLAHTAEVVQAGSVMDAWERLRNEDFDLLVLDVGLPDGSGLELLPALKKSSSFPIPSIIFSAHEMSPRTARHVSAALLKSKTSNEELLGRIRSLLPSPFVGATPSPVEICP
jgi:DNA-binding response OmpR family regulator